MRKINLKAKNLPNKEKNGIRFAKSFVFIGFLLLLIAGGLYGVVFYLNDVQAKKIAVIKTDIQNLKNNLDKNDEYKELYDFQDRLLEIEQAAKVKTVQVGVLNKISETTLNQSVLKSLKITMNEGGSKVEMTTRIADLNTLAEQLDSYSVADTSSQASLKSTSLKDDGIEASLEFMIYKEDIPKESSEENINTNN